MSQSAEDFLKDRISQRIKEGSLRSTGSTDGLADFCSNDYLGFARIVDHSTSGMRGSTGSRLISGDSKEVVDLEKFLATHHKFPAALIFNSGYNANLGLFSALSTRDSVIIYDELIHASIRDGVRLGLGRSFSFRHNDVNDLRKKLSTNSAERIYIAVESLYSMDGDIAPLKEIVSVAKEFNAALIVDEAHSTGIYGERGEGLVPELGIEKEVFARIHTFGKALGAHGAVVGGSEALRQYLINFSRPFIYSTFLPPAEIASIRYSYKLLEERSDSLNKLRKNIELFRSLTGSSQAGPVHAFIIPGNENVKRVSSQMQSEGFAVKPILSPTVPAGEERLRICIHSFNTKEEIERLSVLLAKSSKL